MPRDSPVEGGEPLRALVLLDRSGSMLEQGRWQVALEALESFRQRFIADPDPTDASGPDAGAESRVEGELEIVLFPEPPSGKESSSSCGLSGVEGGDAVPHRQRPWLRPCCDMAPGVERRGLDDVSAHPPDRRSGTPLWSTLAGLKVDRLRRPDLVVLLSDGHDSRCFNSPALREALLTALCQHREHLCRPDLQQVVDAAFPGESCAKPNPPAANDGSDFESASQQELDKLYLASTRAPVDPGPSGTCEEPAELRRWWDRYFVFFHDSSQRELGTAERKRYSELTGGETRTPFARAVETVRRLQELGTQVLLVRLGGEDEDLRELLATTSEVHDAGVGKDCSGVRKVSGPVSVGDLDSLLADVANCATNKKRLEDRVASYQRQLRHVDQRAKALEGSPCLDEAAAERLEKEILSVEDQRTQLIKAYQNTKRLRATQTRVLGLLTRDGKYLSELARWVESSLEAARVQRRERARAAQVGQRLIERAQQSVVAVGDQRRFRCSGVVLREHVVLTARHCLPATRVFAGPVVGGRGSMRRVVEVSTMDNAGADVALLRLDAPLDASPVAWRTRNEAEPPANALRAGGYGDRESSQGRGHYGQRDLFDVPATGTWGCTALRAGQLGCVPGLEMVLMTGARDTCLGDSGGPLLEPVDVEGEGQRQCTWRAVGVTSRPVRSARVACGHGGVYVRIDAVSEWIEETLKRKGWWAP